MTAQKKLNIGKGILILLIIANLLCSCMVCSERSHFDWDPVTKESMNIVEEFRNFTWFALICSVAQIALLLFDRHGLQVVAAIGASGQSLLLPFRVHVMELINDQIYNVLFNQIVAHKHYNWSITPMGYVSSAVALALMACSVVFAVKYARKRRSAEEIRQEEEREEVAV